MKRALAIFMVSMVVLGLLASGISCTKTVYVTATPTLTPALSKTPSPTPTPTTATPTPVTTLKNKSELQKFLNDNFATLNTSIGITKFTFSIDENESIANPYDYTITVQGDSTFFDDLQYSKNISTEMNHIVVGELQGHMEKLAKAVIDKMPGQKLTGHYTTINDNMGVYGGHRYCLWVNYYSPTHKSNAYEDAQLCGFYWQETPFDSLLR